MGVASPPGLAKCVALDECSELLLDVRGQGLVVLGARFGKELVELLGDETAEQELLGVARLVESRCCAVGYDE
jgi:hypothetical protein